MKIQIYFFAAIKADIGLEKLKLVLKEGSKLEDLIKILIQRYKKRAQKALFLNSGKGYKFIVLVNEKKIDDPSNYIIKNGDKIYFMSPITGG